MKRSKIFIAALAMGASLMGAIPAMAATYVWDFTDTDSTVVASGHLTTDASAYVSGNVIGISGTVFGSDIITGLIPNLSAPNTATSPDGRWYYDNTLQFLAPYVTNPGLLFDVSGPGPATSYNLFSDSASQYELWADNSGNYGTDTYGLFHVTAVPEPATWALLFLGFGAIGWMLRGRNREQGSAAIA